MLVSFVRRPGHVGYTLDAVNGSVIYHASVPAAGGVCDVQATLTENWLVYQYFDDELPGTEQSK